MLINLRAMRMNTLADIDKLADAIAALVLSSATRLHMRHGDG